MEEARSRKNILQEAYELLFPNHNTSYKYRVIYSGRFKDFGSHIRMEGTLLELKLSKKYQPVSREIQIGLAQELLCRIFRKNKNTIYIDLYNNFIKNLHIAIPKNRTTPLLQASFERVNQRYFLGLVEQPNLVWGKPSKRTLGSYNFKNDTVTVSKIFQEAPDKLLDYVMFHEMLHKQRKFETSGQKTRYHDSKFRQAEKIYQNAEEIEKQLNAYVSTIKIKHLFGL